MSADEALLKDIAREAVSQAGFEACETAEAEQASKELARRLAQEVLKAHGLETAQAALDVFVDQEIKAVARFG
jgi:hypothetical protein